MTALDGRPARRRPIKYVEAAAINPASPTESRPCPVCGEPTFLAWIGRTLRDVTLDGAVDLFTDRYRVHQCPPKAAR